MSDKWIKVNDKMWATVDFKGRILDKIKETEGPCYALYSGKIYFGEFISLEAAKNYRNIDPKSLKTSEVDQDADPWLA